MSVSSVSSASSVPSASPVASVSSLASLNRAVDSHDPRFDGVFYVAITTTRVYCRPVCPSRDAAHQHRRFFDSAAAAERAGFRPCLRCRPELAPGRSVFNAVSRLACAAAQRIAAGALNGRSVAELARELGVGERHLRRALERELGVAPLALAQTHRLLLAKRLLADTRLPVTRVAYASGFQSLRRFNATFREQYGLPPSALRNGAHARRTAKTSPEGAAVLRLALAYRAPFAWGALLEFLRRSATPGVELVEGGRYARTARIGEHTGVVTAEDAPQGGHVAVTISESLLPALMPLIAGLRRLFDLDAEPAVVDAHLSQGGLGALVARCPGARVPGALDGFHVALDTLLGSRVVARHVAGALGEPFASGIPGLTHLAPTAARVAEAGAAGLVALGAAPARAACIAALAARVADGALRLEPGADAAATRRALLEIEGVGERLAGIIEMRALAWPDGFPATDRALQRAAGARSADALLALAEQWRPWRAYAAVQLWGCSSAARASFRG